MASSSKELKRCRTLGSALTALELSDAQFGSSCEPALHRTLVWKYRTGRKIPRGDTAENILGTLRRLGVEMTLSDLLAASRNAA